MKKLFIVASVAMAVAFSFTSCENKKEVKLSSHIDSVSYALGMNDGMSLGKLPGESINKELFVSAFITGFKNDSNALLLTQEQVKSLLDVYNQEIQDLFMKEMREKNKAKGDSALRANKEKEGVIVTESGLQYKKVVVGNGPVPTKDDKVKVSYTGKFVDGRVFDSSEWHGQPAEFKVSEVIPGWTEALQLMPVGSKFELLIPSDLAYGDNGSRGIEPGSTLAFDVELLGIVK